MKRRKFIPIFAAGSTLTLVRFAFDDSSAQAYAPLTPEEQSLIVKPGLSVILPSANAIATGDPTAGREPPPPPSLASTTARQMGREVDVDRPSRTRYTPAPGLTKILELKVLRAFMRTVYFAEGTWYRGTTKDPYRICYTFATFASFKDHPRQQHCAIHKGIKLCSDASGAPQFLSRTWDGLRANYSFWHKSVEAFAPENQDLGMLYLMGECGAYWALMRGVSVSAGKVFVNAENFKAAIIKASPIWASLPNAQGVSAHNQGVRKMTKLIDVFNKELKIENAA